MYKFSLLSYLFSCLFRYLKEYPALDPYQNKNQSVQCKAEPRNRAWQPARLLRNVSQHHLYCELEITCGNQQTYASCTASSVEYDNQHRCIAQHLAAPPLQKSQGLTLQSIWTNLYRVWQPVDVCLAAPPLFDPWNNPVQIPRGNHKKNSRSTMILEQHIDKQLADII